MADPASDRPNCDPSQRDLAWVGYHPRAAAPLFVIGILATGLVLTSRWAVQDLSELVDRVGALVVFALAWAVWPGLIGVFLYRTITFTYRLTDRAVLADFGMFARPVAPVPLVDVTTVAADHGWWAMLFGVGWVEVRTPMRNLLLPGIRRPEAFAARIRTAAHAATHRKAEAQDGKSGAAE